MRHAGILIVLGLLLAAGGCGMRVPPGFKAKDGTIPEPYSKTGWAKEIVHEKTGIEMVFIPAGEFMMGSPEREKGRLESQGPVHRVRITKPFYMGKYEVTQGEWEKVMGDNPSDFKLSDRLPVEGVSWNDCQDFCRRAGNGLRLPTEAEWEYACRAGSRGRFCFGDDGGNLGDYAWYGANSGNATNDVGQKKPNAWGLYDMHGNVWEWCSDWYRHRYYAESPENDPPGPNEGRDKVTRGGGWGSDPWSCRSALRDRGWPEGKNMNLGFRLALDLKWDSMQPETGPKIEKGAEVARTPKDVSAIRILPGFKAKDRTIPEPYGKTGWAKEIVHEKTGIEMVFIPAGEFMMGSPAGEKDRFEFEGPVHRVRITKPFYMGKYEVTQGEWGKVMDSTPSHFQPWGSAPVETVSWEECYGFCRGAGNGLRLPTEAEWEYACRAGTRTRFSFGDNDRELGGYAWYGENSDERTHEGGTKEPNAWGLYDMHGNVREWCADWYGDRYYAESPANDPQGPVDGKFRVLRGGGWGGIPRDCRSAVRSRNAPDRCGDSIGFRVSLDLK